MSDVMEPFIYKLGEEVPHDVVFVIVHHSVKILPDYVFCDSVQLKEVKLPEGLEEIGGDAFAMCVSLEHINWPSTLIKIGDYAFDGCRSLKEVKLPEGLEEIGAEAFFECTSLEQINCPSTLIKIGDSAFYGCRSLKQVKLSEGLEEIGAHAFRGCVSLVWATGLF